MRDLRAFFRSAPLIEFSGTVYRICPARYCRNALSMRGSFLHGARYNIRAYFGTLYTSLSSATAQREMARYFTVQPIGGFVEASIGLKLSRVADLTDRHFLRRAKLPWEPLTATGFTLTQEIGLRAWEAGIEALLVPSAANPAEQNLAVFLDSQDPPWHVELKSITPTPASASITSARERKK